MTNREKLLNTNIYDLLVTMNEIVMKSSVYEICVLDALEKNYVECKENTCEECIQKYLNKEV